MQGDKEQVVFTIDEALDKIQGSPPLRKVKAFLDGTDLSADLKALLYDVAKVTIKVGEVVVAVGRRVLDIAMTLVAKFPNMTLGVIVAVVISTVVSGFVWPALAAALTKLLILLGLTAGAIEDIRQNAMKDAMDRIAAQFAPIQNIE